MFPATHNYCINFNKQAQATLQGSQTRNGWLDLKPRSTQPQAHWECWAQHCVSPSCHGRLARLQWAEKGMWWLAQQNPICGQSTKTTIGCLISCRIWEESIGDRIADNGGRRPLPPAKYTISYLLTLRNRFLNGSIKHRLSCWICDCGLGLHWLPFTHNVAFTWACRPCERVQHVGTYQCCTYTFGQHVQN